VKIPFNSRSDAGHELALLLSGYTGSHAVVVGLARGGVIVAATVAADLGLPVRALIVQKIGAPDNPELALGAVSETGAQWLDERIATATHADSVYLAHETERQISEARRRQDIYALAGSPQSLSGKTAIVVDDGIATGASALVALRSARQLGAVQVVLSTPVASEQAIRKLHREADEITVLATPEPFVAVGCHYVNFDQATDEDVLKSLGQAENHQPVEKKE
jgi:putative phosphoribosyl transferase